MSISGFSLGALPRIPANGAIYGVAHDYQLSASSLSSQAITVNHEQGSRVCALAHSLSTAVFPQRGKHAIFFSVEIFMGLLVG